MKPIQILKQENQIAFRNGTRFVARAKKFNETLSLNTKSKFTITQNKKIQILNIESFKLISLQAGLLNTLSIEPIFKEIRQ